MAIAQKDTRTQERDRDGESGGTLPGGKRSPGPEDLRLGRILGPTSLLEGPAATKEGLIRSLAEAIARDRGYADPAAILRAALEREAVINTYLGDGVAVPHARVSGFTGFGIAIARSPEGFPYGVETPEPVKLVILLVGDDALQNEHVRHLGAIAAALKDGALREEILKAPDAAAVGRILEAGRTSAPRRRPHQLSRLLLSHARRISREVGANAVLVAIDSPEELAIIKRLPRRDSFIIASSSASIVEAAEKVVRRVIRLPWSPLRRDSLVRLGTLMGISTGLLTRDDVVAFISRQGGRPLDTITILDVGREFGRFLTSAGDISARIQPGVLERVIVLASELATEGREGRPIGTIFVIGDPQELTPYTQQMVMNPFRGYPEEERNILDPTLRETVKEFSWLDGAFIVRGDGVIHSAGTFLRPGRVEVNLPGGYGTRHRAASGITKVVDAVALAISQSSGNVMVFKDGEILLTLEKGAVR